MEEFIQTLASVEPLAPHFWVSRRFESLRLRQAYPPEIVEHSSGLRAGVCHRSLSQPTDRRDRHVTATGGGKGLAYVLAPTQRPLLVS
jgi:hypothetical protein